MASNLEQAQADHARQAIEESRATIKRMDVELEKWKREGRYELWRLAVFTVIGAAALLAAGAAGMRIWLEATGQLVGG